MDSISLLFQDFLILRTFQISEDPIVRKRVMKKMLKELFEALPEPWKIMGITPAALALMQQHGFDKKEASGKSLPIQRAHLKDRDDWYHVLFSQEWESAEKWFQYIVENDATVLALSTENKQIATLPYIRFTAEAVGLFRSTRISWTHNRAERNYLRALAEGIQNESVDGME